ncbi:hypothetical protein [Prescottella agglutinans]|uniref:Vacuolar-type H+-ATPase subunit H n=1 Tax=Prescottella agglutinans TaxID=1644129 RepID=A0ABT6MG21_9NOCA|nr:hypothetical protein [Prescottella agglutinans]MDH6283222.1 vacuolar-type H+-ATPase subunit H [Prescottella agglutinans]
MSDNAIQPGDSQDQSQADAVQHDTDALPDWAREKLTKANQEAAKYRTKANANADAARRLAEIEDANKSESQRLSDALAAAERDRDSARTEALRLRIATKYGISDEDADDLLTGSDEETLTRQAERLTARESDRKKQGNHVPREGTNPTATPNEERTFVREFFGG